MPSKKQKTRLAGNQARQTGRIGAVATKSTEQQSTDYLSPSFRFTHADQNKYCLNEWTPQELDSLVSTWQKMERMTWAQIRTSGGHHGSGGGIGWTPIDRSSLPALPDSVPEDVEIHEVRVTQRMRLFGYRGGTDAIFYVVWFDREHKVCPV